MLLTISCKDTGSLIQGRHTISKVTFGLVIRIFTDLWSSQNFLCSEKERTRWKGSLKSICLVSKMDGIFCLIIGGVFSRLSPY